VAINSKHANSVIRKLTSEKFKLQTYYAISDLLVNWGKPCWGKGEQHTVIFTRIFKYSYDLQTRQVLK